MMVTNTRCRRNQGEIAATSLESPAPQAGGADCDRLWSASCSSVLSSVSWVGSGRALEASWAERMLGPAIGLPSSGAGGSTSATIKKHGHKEAAGCV